MKNNDAISVIVILGAAVWADGKPSPSLERRTRRAARLWIEQDYEYLIPSGAIGLHEPSEAEVMSEILVAEGIPPDAIMRDDQSRTTFETAMNVSKMLADRKVDRLTAVTDPSHAPRTWLVLRSYGLPVDTVTTLGQTPKSRLSTTVKQYLRELIALPYYATRCIAVLVRRV